MLKVKTARRKRSGVLSPRSTDRRCRRHRPAAGQGDAGGRGRRPDRRGRFARCPKRAKSRCGCSPQGPRGPRRHAALGGPRHGPGRDAAVRGRAAGLRPDRRQRLLLRLRTSSSRISEEDFPRIEAEMAKIVKEDEPFERVEMEPRRGDPVLRGPGAVAQGRAHRRRAGRRGDRVVLSPGRVHRPVPRPARARRRRDRGLQAALGRRGLLEGRRLPASNSSGSTAPPGSASRTWTTT